MTEDPLGAGKALESVEKLTRELRASLRDFLQPGAQEAGRFIADKIRFLRWKNAVRSLENAKELLKEKGIEMGPVPLRLLLPLIEGASLEDENEQELVSSWAGLLASASAGSPVLASYPRILAELTPVEARILEYVSGLQEEATATGSVERLRTGQWGVSRESIVSATGLDDSRFPVVAGNLMRLGLVDAAPTEAYTIEEGEPSVLRERHFKGLVLTPLGTDFIGMCRGPDSASA